MKETRMRKMKNDLRLTMLRHNEKKIKIYYLKI